MPAYDLTCQNPACRHQYSDLHPMKAEHGPCPRCGGAGEVDWARQGAPRSPASDLHGSRQIIQDIQTKPSTVPALRKLYGEGIGHAWQDNGTVKVAGPSEARKFAEKDRQVRAMFAEQKAAGLLTTRKERKLAKMAARPKVPT